MNQPTNNQPSLPQPVVPRRRRNWLLVLLPFLATLVLAAGLFAVFGPGPLTEETTLIVPHGAGPRDVAASLDNEHAVYHPLLFRIAVKVLAENTIKAGEYQLAARQSLAEIVRMIHEGRSVTRLFTVAEGLTSKDIASLINASPTLAGDAVPVPVEGSLMPESYRYIYGDNRAALVARMQKAMQDELNDLWTKRDPNVPLATPEQAIVLASIIEKETGKPSERPRIAGVFVNRLRLPMRLQSDPTVIYGIVLAKGAMNHAITHDDLEFPSPYNTYTNDGLPPHPICNPGRAALEAALHPEANDFLYFVADGTGGHAFSHTIAEHNRNVTKWNNLQEK